MYPTVPIAMFGWIPVVLILFNVMAGRTAVIVSFLGAWMFLPSASYEFPGFPNYTKTAAASVPVFLGMLLFDAGRLKSFRLSRLDGFMLIWCLCPFASSITNGLGAYDGVSAIFSHLLMWGLPYFIGRVYFRNSSDLLALALGLFIAGLVYVPLCLLEIRLSPQLNRWVYGFGGAGIAYASDLGKWGSRPRVFMDTALTVGLFMSAASLAGLWIWSSGARSKLYGISVGALLAVLLIVTLACKNVGALAILAGGALGLIILRYWNSKWPVWLLIAAAPAYMVARTVGGWSADSLVNAAGMIHQDREGSLQFRLDNEDLLIEKALRRPVFGWGGWGRARVHEEDWRGELRDVTIVDGMWILALGNTGLVGLISITGVLIFPSAILWSRMRGKDAFTPSFGPPALASLLLVLYAIDNLFNAMANPIYLVAAGGLVSWLVALRVTSSQDLYRLTGIKSPHQRRTQSPRAISHHSMPAPGSLPAVGESR